MEQASGPMYCGPFAKPYAKPFAKLCAINALCPRAPSHAKGSAEAFAKSSAEAQEIKRFKHTLHITI